MLCAVIGLACGLLFPVAWVVGHEEVVAIDQGQRDPANRSTAKVAKIIGMIGTFLVVGLIFFYVFAIGFVITPPG